MKQPIKMTPGDELHLTALMAPFSLNLVTGQDRQHLLGYGRSAFEAGKESAGQCLHQIQEPALVQAAQPTGSVSNATSQATTRTRFCPECGHVGEVSADHRDCCPDGSHAFMVPAKWAQDLRAVFLARFSQAAPAAVAVPDERAALRDAEARLTLLIERGQAKLLDVVARDACRAALAATPAAAPSLISSLKSILADADAGPPTDSQWCCKECGQWTPWNHPEAHDHEDGCTAPREYAKRRDWKSRISTLIAAIPAATAPVVLPKPEAVVSEVMELVKDWAQRDLIAGEAGIDALSEESSEKQHQEAKRLDGEAEASYRAIEAKLRALLAGVAAPAARGAPLKLIEAINTACGGNEWQGGALVTELLEPACRAIASLAPQAKADAQDELTDSAMLDAMERQRIAVVPEYEGPWDAEVYNDEGQPNHRGSGSTPREAIRAAIAAQAAAKGGAQE